jgi:hypothetical protein
LHVKCAVLRSDFFIYCMSILPELLFPLIFSSTSKTIRELYVNASFGDS